MPASGKTSFTKKEEMSKKEKEKTPDERDANSSMDLPEMPDVTLSARPLNPSTPTMQDMIQTTLAPVVDNVEFRSERSEAGQLQSSPRETSPESTSQSSIKTPSPIKKKTSSPPRYALMYLHLTVFQETFMFPKLSYVLFTSFI